MLTETAFQNDPCRHLFDRGDANEVSVGPHALSGAIELMGASMSFRRNAEIYGEKEPTDYFYKVVRGAVRTYKVLMDGRRQIGAFYLPGEIFGLETGEEHVFSAEAIVDTKILIVKRSVAISHAAQESAIARQLWTLTGCELQRTQNHLLLLGKSAAERVASFLLEMAERSQSGDEIRLPMSRQDIGDYLGLTIETVSRVLTRFEKEAAIDLPTCKRVVLRDRSVLQRLLD
jgi:CRP/FNR family nitrogen fixation transcriptional regulator